ncbi:hypothetical protein P152DRAFT_456662 [Eremomyces bilateralis CBS 781.70]|uniref:HMA domain-containing protein n=1 Tax=Eremomyces bilateralis CBS 781.70 TaxID=1392243 RepID=A0A6G1G932_9PEZI|nr:uncharacterized protein P152DRAFT_456662 [Eremomyces bilateralis CBS 781.70]KAF1814410.1 hypothetical protein P152DRAFT_456662 [Eremomyces bilateralis CBS 781.70]
MSEHVYKFNVVMTCGGCSGAIDRVLKRLDGMNPWRLASEALDQGNLLTFGTL